jgi:hypothetical protein
MKNAPIHFLITAQDLRPGLAGAARALRSARMPTANGWFAFIA